MNKIEEIDQQIKGLDEQINILQSEKEAIIRSKTVKVSTLFDVLKKRDEKQDYHPSVRSIVMESLRIEANNGSR